MIDLTGIWAFMQQHKAKIGPVLAGLLLFLSGWQFGRISSPYYASSTIIFQDREGSGSGGSLTELRELQAESAALAEENNNTQPAVAGASATQGQYVASVNSDLFHHKDCASAKRIKEENRVWFTTAQEALAAGFEPSTCAKEKGIK